MAFTIGDCITAARAILQDTQTPYRYPDADLYALFSTAVLEARRLRPDLFVASILLEQRPYTVADAGSPIPFSSTYQAAVINFVVGRAELRDDQFNSDGRASAMLSAFKAQLSTNTA